MTLIVVLFVLWLETSPTVNRFTVFRSLTSSVLNLSPVDRSPGKWYDGISQVTVEVTVPPTASGVTVLGVVGKDGTDV